MFEYDATHIRHLELSEFPKGEISATWLHIINNGIGEAVRIPILIARGEKEGPVMGVTAALHGNELNGIAVIQDLFAQIDITQLSGSIVGVLIANPLGLLMEQREFNNGVDLNHLAPGKPNGNQGELFMWRLIHRIVDRFDYLIDLHTASFGRVNSYYIRADMSDPKAARMARLQNPEIILDNPPNDYTLRGHVSSLGIPAITPELQDPHRFQDGVIEQSLTGIKNHLYDINMLPGQIIAPMEKTILCDRSFWTYTDEGGLLEVFPTLGQIVEMDEPVAEVKTIFGDTVKTFFAPVRGIVIGKSVSPINQSGSRIIHIGVNPREIPDVPSGA